MAAKTRKTKGTKPLKSKVKSARASPRKSRAKTNVTTATCPLNSAIDVRREMAKVYREARGGVVETSKASKLVFMLGNIRQAIETQVLEQKLGELELAARKQGLLGGA